MANVIKKTFGGQAFAVLTPSAMAEILDGGNEEPMVILAEQAQRTAAEAQAPAGKKTRGPRAKPVVEAPPPDAEQEDDHAFE